MTTPPHIRLAVALAALGLTAAAAPAADAASVSSDPSGAIVVTGDSDRDRIGFQASGYGDGRLIVYAGVDGISSATSACEETDPYFVSCDWNPAVGARMDLGAGDDDGYVSSDLPPGAVFALGGGDGADDLRASDQGTRLDGGPGDDVLKGWTGADHLIGGDGNDEIEGYAAGDRIEAGGGDDVISGDGVQDPSADSIDGGAGVDVVESDWMDSSYSSAASPPVAVTLGGGADDGRAGEGDDLRAVEKVVTHQQSRLVGSDAGEHLEVFQDLTSSELIGNGGDDRLKASGGADRVDGGAGDDDLDAGFGDDVVVGGPGRDTISADLRGGDCGPLWCTYPYGNDTVEARDGERDSVLCGFGEDRALVDAIDVVAPDCENVTRGGAPGSGAGAAGAAGGKGALAVTVRRAKLRRALARGVRVSFTAPGAGRLRAVARHGGRTVATGARAVRAAGRTTVTLRFTAKARRSLRRARTAKLKIALRFTPRKGAAIRQTVAATLRR
jgi:Ca2+-binding RTX toxin-like protein